MNLRRIRPHRRRFLAFPLVAIALGVNTLPQALRAGSAPVKSSHGMVVSQNRIASQVGVQILKQGGTATDAAVATAFALAVVHPAAGNIGGGGFFVYRPRQGEPTCFDFRERAPAAATPDMWLVDGTYDEERHHQSHLSVGVPGTVAGLHMAWKQNGKLPWSRLVQPAIKIAQQGFEVTHGLAESLAEQQERFRKYPASAAIFMQADQPLEPGHQLVQPDLANTLVRIAELGPAGFYEGETADLIVAEMQRHKGLITHDDLRNYQAIQRKPLKGTYRGYEVIGMPPPSSGGVCVIQMLNVLEGYDLTSAGFASAANYHRMAEAMRRAFADRAQYLGDPEANPDMPLKRLISKSYANQLRTSIHPTRASRSSIYHFNLRQESRETTHLSVVDKHRNAVALTYTLEHSYGSAIVVSGAGFLLNNEMGDFNPVPNETTETGRIGTPPNLTAPGKRMLSSMSPTILSKDGKVVMVTGSPGGRTIINTVLQTIVNVIDFGMNAQEAVDAGRIHHQWFPNELRVERYTMSPETRSRLVEYGHQVIEGDDQGSAQIIVVDPETEVLSAGSDQRRADAGGAGY